LPALTRATIQELRYDQPRVHHVAQPTRLELVENSLQATTLTQHFKEGCSLLLKCGKVKAFATGTAEGT
jgi:hypothetical protein